LPPRPETLIVQSVLVRSKPLAQIWIALAALEERQKRSAAALAILDEAQRQLGDLVEFRMARARYWAGHPGDDAQKALAALRDGLELYPETDRLRLLRVLASVYADIGEKTIAEQIWGQMAEQHDKDLVSRLALFDMALKAGNEDRMTQMVDQIKEIQGAQGALWRRCRIDQLVRKALQEVKANPKHAPDCSEARALLASIAVRRSTWPRIPLCEAFLDDMTGKPESALANYLRALQMGERDLYAMRRAVELLFVAGRDREAYQLVCKIPEKALLADNWQHVAAEVFLRAQDSDHALSLAKRVVADGSKDYKDYLVLGVILANSGKTEEAGEYLYRARSMADKQPEVWVTLIRFLVASKQTAKAESELDKASLALGDGNPLALAQCYEAVGQPDKAKEFFKKACDAKPNDVVPLRALAEFCMHNRQFTEAEPLLRAIIERSKDFPEAADWATQCRAVLLALDGDKQEAIKALDAEAAQARRAPGATVTKERTTAQIKALYAGRQPRREAIQILEKLVEQKVARADDLFLLGQLYVVVGEWPKARERMSSLVTRPDGNRPAYLAYFARELFRHEEADDGEALLKRLAKQQPNNLITQELRARLLKAQGKKADALALLEAEARSKDANLPAIAALLEELGELKAAEAMYRKYVQESKQPNAPLVLTHYLIRQKRYREALDSCEPAWATCQPIAVAQACLIVLAATPGDRGNFERVDRWLREAVQKKPDAIDLLTAQAGVYIFMGRHEATEQIYRKILAKNPNNPWVLNNLAWVLSLSKNGGPEALALVNRAIDREGPTPELLDTRAMAYLALGQAESALRDLDQVIAERPSASSYFHQAQAYRLVNRTKDAVAAWQDAKKNGLTLESLQPLEQPMFRRMREALKVQ
jgi:tetratricopeptide (TPR) repeat protein